MDIDVRGDAPVVESIPFPVMLGGAFAAHLLLATLAGGWEVPNAVGPPVWFATAATAATALLVRPTRRPAMIAAGLAAQTVYAAVTLATVDDVVGDVVVTAVELVAAVVVFARVFVPAASRGFHVATALAFGASVGVAALGGLVAAAWFAGDGESFGRWFWSFTNAHALGMVVVGATVMLFREPRGWLVDVATRGTHIERVGTIAASLALTIAVFTFEAPVTAVVVLPPAWLAVRFGPAVSFPGACVALGLTAWLTDTGSGPIADSTDAAVELAALHWALAFAGVFLGRYSRSVDLDRLRDAAMMQVIPDPMTVVNRAGDPVDRLAGSLDATDSDWLRSGAAALRADAIADGGVATDEFTMGDGRTLEVRMIRLDDEHVLSIARDVTDAATTRELLRRATEYWKRIASTAYEGFAEVDRNMRITFVSERWAEMLGVERSQLLGTVFSDMFEPDDWAKMAPYAAQAIAGDRVTFEEEIRRPDGTRLWVLVSADPELDAAGRFESCVLFAADTTVHHRELARRVAVEAELASLERRERARIGRVLHDGPLQTVVAMSYHLNRLGRNEPELGRVEGMALEAIRQMRGTLDDLRPPRVDDGQLAAALIGVGERYRSGDGPELVVRDHTEPPLSGDAAAAIFRIGREAIANAMIHADAASVTTTVIAVEGGLEITVADDGRGFTDVGPVDGHLGLGLIRDRAREAGGRSRVDSSASGTVVVAWVPDEVTQGGDGGE